jgi:hypothetical protein
VLEAKMAIAAMNGVAAVCDRHELQYSAADLA